MTGAPEGSRAATRLEWAMPRATLGSMPRHWAFPRSAASTERGEISVRAASADATSSVVGAPLSADGAGESVAPVALTHLTGRKPLSVETPISSASRGGGRAVRDDAGGGWL